MTLEMLLGASVFAATLRLAAPIALAALLFGAFVHGGAYMQSHAGISSNLVAIVQAFVLFVIAAETRVRALTRRRGRKPVEAIA